MLPLIAMPASQLTAQTVPATHAYTAADVDFIQGMIVHHAQAVVMSDWAPTRGEGANFLILCKRIALSQRDEIAMMQRWLVDHHLPTPDPLHMLHDTAGPVVDMSSMHMPGMDMGAHPMMMSGMLTPDEMRKLEGARGIEFDRLYLTGMIKHHQGALDMVAALFATPGSGQEPELSGFANDVDASQRAQMARMEAMLKTINTSQKP
jgi:uncharacterized protein (DUF305 family)